MREGKLYYSDERTKWSFQFLSLHSWWKTLFNFQFVKFHKLEKIFLSNSDVRIKWSFRQCFWGCFQGYESYRSTVQKFLTEKVGTLLTHPWRDGNQNFFRKQCFSPKDTFFGPMFNVFFLTEKGCTSSPINGRGLVKNLIKRN